MDELEGLRLRCLEFPDDDLSRGVYADRLTETNDPANMARADLIRLQLARHEGGRKGETSGARMDAVAKSLRAEEKILGRYGREWLPEKLRGGPSWGVAFKSEVIELTDHFWGVSDRFTFERGFIRSMSIGLIPIRSGDYGAIAAAVASILATDPVEVIEFRADEFAGPVVLRAGINYEHGFRFLFMAPLRRMSNAAYLTFTTRKEMVAASASFVEEFLPLAPRMPEPYTRDFYEETAGPLPEGELTYPELPEAIRRQLDDRDAEARNRVDMPHER